MPRNTGSTKAVFVTMPFGGGTLKYGFNSRLNSAKQDNFGQAALSTVADVSLLVVGSNRPKPARASIRLVTGYEGSFCSSEKISALRAAGYTVSAPKFASKRGGKFAKSYYVNINGMKIAFLSNATPAEYGLNIFPSTFGLELATANDQLIYSPTFPRLALTSSPIAGPGGKGFSSQTDPTKVDNVLADVEGEWKEEKKARYTLEHFKAIYG